MIYIRSPELLYCGQGSAGGSVQGGCALFRKQDQTRNSDIGLNPTNDGEVIRIPIPPLSEERRKELGKVASKSSEDAKVSIRSHRRYGIDEISKLKDENSADEIKRLESKVQELTDKYVNKIDELLLVKQNELLEV